MQTNEVAHRDSIVYGWSLSWFLWHEETRSIFTTPWMGCYCIAGLPPALRSPEPIYKPVWGEALVYCSVKSLPKNTTQYMSSARAGTRTTRYGDDRTNHDTTAPLNSSYTKVANLKNYSGDEAGADEQWLQDGFI